MRKAMSLLLAGLLAIGLAAGWTQGSGAAGSVAFASETGTNTITEKVKEEDTDSAWDATGATTIALHGTDATVSGGGATVSGGTVTIGQAGTYVVTGTLTEGQIRIDAGKTDTVRLVLNGVDIAAGGEGANAAIYAAVAEKLIIILAEGADNTVADGTSYTYADAEKEEPNAAIFSKCDLSICGEGALTVNGNWNHGIATKDDLVIASGNITVSAVGAALRGKDSVTILGGVFTLASQAGDGIKSANDTDADKGWVLIKGGVFTIEAYEDGIQAETALQIDGGTFAISTGGGWPGGSLKRGSHTRTNEGVVSENNPADGSYKGLKAGSSIVISGGTFTISAYDDAIHSNGDLTIIGGALALQSGKQSLHADNAVTIHGGTIDIQNSFEGIEGSFININGGSIDIVSTDDGINVTSSSGLLTVAGGNVYINAGGDGIDSNNSVVVSGGTVYVDGPTAADDGALDYQNQFSIDGGTLVAVCLNGMPQAPGSYSSQNAVMVYYSAAQKAGTEITLTDANGTALIAYAPQKDYSSAVLSAAGLTQGQTYTLWADGTKLCDITLTAAITSVSDSGAAVSGAMGGGQRQQGPGGGMGGRGPGG